MDLGPAVPVGRRDDGSNGLGEVIAFIVEVAAPTKPRRGPGHRHRQRRELNLFVAILGGGQHDWGAEVDSLESGRNVVRIGKWLMQGRLQSMSTVWFDQMRSLR